MPHLSIIIPTWNTAQVTQKCIRTINKYLPAGYAQIIIVDNGSTDNTQKLLSSQKGIVYIRNSENLGFSKANNIGAKKAVAPILLFLNSDMELIDSSMADLVDFFNSHPEIGAIGPQFLNIDLTPQGSVLPDQSILNAFKEYILRIPAYSKYVPNVSSPQEVVNISGGALLIRKTDFEHIHGWDESYFFFYEDLALCREIRNLGKTIYYYPQCRVVHRHGFSGRTVADPANQWRRLIPGSILYHGRIRHFIINRIIWIGQKFHRLIGK